MKSNLRDKFRDFLESEEGRVGAKAPLAVGIAGGSLLLAQAMLPTDAQAHMECDENNPCSPGEICLMWVELAMVSAHGLDTCPTLSVCCSLNTPVTHFVGSAIFY